MKKKFFKEYEKENSIKEFDETFKDITFEKLPKKRNYKQASKVRKVKLGIFYTCLSTVIATSLVIGIPFAAFIISGIKVQNRFTTVEKQFSKIEMQIASSNTFKKLNDINYPTEGRKPKEVNEEFIKATNEFTNKIYSLADDKKDFNFSPLSLYSHLDFLSVIANESFQAGFDELLGWDQASRKQDVIDTFLNNFQIKDDQGIYLFNGLFIDNSLSINDTTLNELTSRYVETFHMDFGLNEDIDKMILWINNHQEGRDISKDSLNLNIPDFMPLLLASSSFYFNYKWLNKFSDFDTYEDCFYMLDGSTKNQQYMNHSYMGDIYRYENYDSFYDYYSNGYKIQYVSPKDINTSIFDAIKDTNFLIENENNKEEYVAIDLSVPKFTKSSGVDFTNILTKSPIRDIYFSSDSNVDAFKEKLQTDLDLNIQLLYTKQQNEISFSEDGTEVKSLTFSLGGAETAPSPDSGYEIKLNSPFIYVIRDANNIPLFFGTMNG